MTVHNWMECYNITGELDDDDPLEINMLELEGIPIVEGASITNDQFLKPLNIKKVNIGSNENPNSSNIGYYWDDKTMGNITTYYISFRTCSLQIFLKSNA